MKTIRKIIDIDESKCTGCGECIPACPEGALQIIDGKARLISDLFCDGLGACIGDCPENAISVEEREAAPYDERKVMENIVKQGENVIKAHLEHLSDHGQEDYLVEARSFLKEKGIDVSLDDKLDYGTGASDNHFSGCPGARVMDFTEKNNISTVGTSHAKNISYLRQWPVQLMLVPVNASYLKGADLLISADCVPFACADFHEDFLRGRVVLVGCPKFNDVQVYQNKITQILQ